MMRGTALTTLAVSLTVSLVCGSAGVARAQTLSGRVVDGTSDEPLGEARLQLLAPEGIEVGEPVVSGADGSFTISLPEPGSYYLRAERLSYETLVDGVFEFTGPHGRLQIEIYLVPRPLEVEGFDVAARIRRSRRILRAQGFYQRAAAGFGDFIGPEQIESRMVPDVTDHLRAVPGVHFSGRVMQFKSSHPFEGGSCEPNVWLDGMLILSDWHAGHLNQDMRVLDDMVNAQDVAAIEVYRTVSATPLQWGGPNARCGTVVIWTRAGR